MRRLFVFCLLLAVITQAAEPRRRARCWQVAAALGAVVVAGVAGGIAWKWYRRAPSIAHEPEFGREDGLCCVCRYEAIDECARRTEARCGDRVRIDANLNQSDCEWKEGRCESRFQFLCQKWARAEQQQGCVATAIAPERDAMDLKRDFAGKTCQKVRYRYTGHGRGFSGLQRRLETILSTAPDGVSAFELDDDGCHTYKDPAASQAGLRDLCAKQPGLLAGRRVKVSANQCAAYSDDNEFQNRYRFEIDGSALDVSGRAAPCPSECRRGQSGQSIRCLDNGAEVTRTCRCQMAAVGTGQSCSWR